MLHNDGERFVTAYQETYGSSKRPQTTALNKRDQKVSKSLIVERTPANDQNSNYNGHQLNNSINS